MTVVPGNKKYIGDYTYAHWEDEFLVLTTKVFGDWIVQQEKVLSPEACQNLVKFITAKKKIKRHAKRPQPLGR